MTTTTAISTFEDILAVMARDPQLREAMRQHILDDEIRQLPADFQELRATVAELAQVVRDYMAATNARLDRLESGQDELRRTLQEFMAATNARLDRLESGQDELRRTLQEFMAATNARLDRLESGQDELRAGQDELRAGQDELRAGQDELRAIVGGLKAGQDELRKDLNSMVTRQNRMENHLSEVRGQLVPLAARRMLGRITEVTNSRRPRWLKDSDIIDIADDADTSSVPPNELESFRAIDLALRAIDKDSPNGQEHYIIIECTASIARNDIIRAERNAAYMAQFTGQPAKAVVIGHTVPKAVAKLAQEKAVHCLIATNKSGRPR